MRGGRGAIPPGPRAASRVLALAALGLLPAVLAGGVWRLERDRPLWRAPDLWGIVVERPPVPALPRLVLAVHYPWYGTPGGPTGRWRHWNHRRETTGDGRILGFHDPRRRAPGARVDIGAAHYPAEGSYDSRDPALVRRQVAQAQAAGLDGFLVSWWGRESEEARAFGDLLRLARPTGLRLAPYYEAGELWPRGAPGVAADLLALLDRHGDDPAWLRVDGAPVLFVYGAHRLRRPAWEFVRRRLAGARHRVVLIAEIPSLAWLTRHPGWLEGWAGLHVYSPAAILASGDDLAGAYAVRARLAREAGLAFVPAVAPGFDDRTVRMPGTLVPRAAGATYDATWAAALATEPDWILVSTWNEWHEGSEIEPSTEHGTRYLERTAAWAERFRRGDRS